MSEVKTLEERLKRLSKRVSDVKIGLDPPPDIVVPYGPIMFDLMSNIGGVPAGSIVEVCGPNGCGKTTLGMNVLGNAQKMGYVCFIVNTDDYPYPRSYAEKNGVDVDKVVLYNHVRGEEAADLVVDILSDSNTFVLLDSVAELWSTKSYDRDVGDTSAMNERSNILRDLGRKSKDLCAGNGSILFAINQIRDRQMGGAYPPGGNPWGHKLNMRTSIKYVGKETKSGYVSGQAYTKRIQGKTLKNHYGDLYTDFVYYIGKGVGILYDINMYEACKELNIIYTSGHHKIPLFSDSRKELGVLNTKVNACADFLRVMFEPIDPSNDGYKILQDIEWYQKGLAKIERSDLRYYDLMLMNTLRTWHSVDHAPDSHVMRNLKMLSAVARPSPIADSNEDLDLQYDAIF